MELILLIVIASISLLILVYLGYLYNAKPARNARELQNAVPAAREGGPRRAQVVRNRGVRNRARMQRGDEIEEEDNLDEREADTIDDKLGAKKRAKLEAKAEKKAQREVEEHKRQEKKKKDQLADEERKKIEEKERIEEKRLEEEQKKVKEEKDRKEYEEYLKMKEAFSVEEEGYEEGIEDEGRNLLQEFVDHIKTNKVVVIEDLAAHFKLKTQAAIDRIQDLLKDNILTGVIDDRGKFIYVSSQEMEAIAKFIKQRGRVSIAELAERSNELINLKPTSVVS